jgi:hypothetical protein
VTTDASLNDCAAESCACHDDRHSKSSSFGSARFKSVVYSRGRDRSLGLTGRQCCSKHAQQSQTEKARELPHGEVDVAVAVDRLWQIPEPLLLYMSADPVELQILSWSV